MTPRHFAGAGIAPVPQYRRAIPRRRGGERGSVMVFALGFLVVLLVIAAGVHGLVLGQLQGSGRLRQRAAAEALAEGGIARTVAWFAAATYQIPAASLLTTSVPAKLTSNQQPIVLPSNHPDGYIDAVGATRSGVVNNFRASLTNQSGATGTLNVVAALMAAQPETWEVTAIGTAGSVQRRVGALLVRERTALFEEALFGDKDVKLVGNGGTDSYDSTLGAYGGANRFASGGVRSNGDIALKGNARVNGDAKPGPDGEVSLNGNAKVTGLTDPASGARQLAAVTIPAGAVSLGAVKLKNKEEYTIKNGTYVVTDLDVGGNATLTIDSSAGPVTLYVTGKVKISGSGDVMVTHNGPRGLFIFQVGGGDVDIGGSGSLTAAIYAPDSDLKVDGSGALFGAFVGKSADLNGNGAVHFDQSLRTATGAAGPLRLIALWSPP